MNAIRIHIFIHEFIARAAATANCTIYCYEVLLFYNCIYSHEHKGAEKESVKEETPSGREERFMTAMEFKRISFANHTKWIRFNSKSHSFRSPKKISKIINSATKL